MAQVSDRVGTGRFAEDHVALPIAAAVFVLGCAIAVLGDAWATLLDAGMQSLFESAALPRFLTLHLVAGSGMFAAGVMGMVAVKKGSERLLLAGELLGSAVFSAMLILQAMSLWTLQYLE
jgi:hypothetical protein